MIFTALNQLPFTFSWSNNITHWIMGEKDVLLNQ